MRALALRLPRLGIGPQVVVGLLFVALLSAMAIEPTRQLLEQRTRISGMAGDLDELERSNSRLTARIERLQDPDFLEQRAREIGLVRPAETAIVVMPPSERKDKKEATGRSERPPAPRPFSFFEGFLNFVGLL